MDPKEKEALEAYKEEGIEFEDENEPKEPPKKEEDAEPQEDGEAKSKEEPSEKEEDDDEEAKKSKEEEALKEEPPKPKKRSIYKDLKETRKEVKSERELREQAERERDELKAKLESVSNASTKEEKEDALDELESFAEEIGADPSALRKMRELFLKDVEKSNVPEELSSQLSEFQEWQKQNSEAIAKVEFEKEFKQTLPTLTKMLPDMDADSQELIKEELDKLAHTPEFHDKELDYIAFKNQEALKALVSPKKRGLEPKGKADATSEKPFKFDPEADLEAMSPEQLEQWEKEYQKASKADSLSSDSQGRKIFI